MRRSLVLLATAVHSCQGAIAPYLQTSSTTSGASAAAPSGKAIPASTLGVSARQAKANAEILHEMFSVVYEREPQDRAFFGNYLDSLNQGASYEGVYNGFVHSSFYRKLETSNPGASKEALWTFAQELLKIEKTLSTPTAFGATSALPLATPVDPALPHAENPSANTDLRQIVPSGAPVYAHLFQRASIFTLKRVLGDEALKLLSEKRAHREALASWYGSWAAGLSNGRVDFGLPLRNKADPKFHQNWALAATDDQVSWEVLNRLHRLLNDANKKRP